MSKPKWWAVALFFWVLAICINREIKHYAFELSVNISVATSWYSASDNFLKFKRKQFIIILFEFHLGIRMYVSISHIRRGSIGNNHMNHTWIFLPLLVAIHQPKTTETHMIYHKTKWSNFFSKILYFIHS